jgi:S1-C subfamily serine protease
MVMISILTVFLLLPFQEVIMANNASAQPLNNSDDSDNNNSNADTSATQNNDNNTNTSNNNIPNFTSNIVGGANENATTLIIDAYKAVQHSVVDIKPHLLTVGTSPIPIQANASASAGGSGWVYDEAGHIVTNAHVAVAVNNTYDVSFPDGNTYAANVIGVDPFSDLAVLNITQDFSDEHIVPLTLANSSLLEVGQPVLAIGNPYSFQDTLTVGVIGQTQRLGALAESGFPTLEIQTDAAINPGNSGGPLLNLRGQLVGVNHAFFIPISQPGGPSAPSSSAGLNFAIPSNVVAKVVPWLIKYGSFPHPYLGFIGATLTSNIALQAGLPTNLKGVAIGTLVKDGPVDKVGLTGATIDQYGNIRAGDIITEADGHRITKLENLEFYIQEHKSAYIPSLQGNNPSIDNIVTLGIYNYGNTRYVKVVLDYEKLSVAAYCPTCI